MKTAILKTEFWQDDSVFELNSDTRLVYLCLLTNPQRDVCPAFKCSDRMLSAYTGYSVDLIRICRQQLVDSGKINYIDDYYIFTKQDFVQPSRGRDSNKILERYLKELPPKVQSLIEKQGLIIPSISTGGSTSTSTGTPSGTSTGVKVKYSKVTYSNVKQSNTKLKQDADFEEIKKLYYEVVKILKIPIMNHGTLQNKIKSMSREDEPEKIKQYLVFMRDRYHKLDFEYKPAVSDALDIYRKRVQIINAIKQEAKNSGTQKVWRSGS